MTDMLWIVPTRGRPANAKDLIDSLIPTRCYTDVLFVIDKDDPCRSEYLDVMKGAPSWVEYVLHPERMMLGPKLNMASMNLADLYDYIGFMGDDHRPRTPIWDGLIGAELRKMGTGIVYGNDLFQRQNLPTAVCMTTNIISELGYMIPPEIEHLYCDNFWLELGRVLGIIRYREDVIIEHVHPHAGKAETDEQYEQVNSGEQDEKDREGFERYKRERFADDVKRLMKLVK